MTDGSQGVEGLTKTKRTVERQSGQHQDYSFANPDPHPSATRGDADPSADLLRMSWQFGNAAAGDRPASTGRGRAANEPVHAAGGCSRPVSWPATTGAQQEAAFFQSAVAIEL